MSESHVWIDFWKAVGIVAAVLFYGRFYIQWIVSELRKESVVPLAFWYMSCAGSLMLLGYAVSVQSPIGALSHCFNILVYTRNLVHIWKGRGKLSARGNRLIHLVVGIIVVGAVALAAKTWLVEYHVTQQAAAHVAKETWLWLAVGVAGQALFACRFIIQWIATERQRKSVFPVSFWYISVVASLLLMACHLQRGELLFAIGLIATILIYLRNLWFIHFGRRPEPLSVENGPLALEESRDVNS